ncbi:MAG: CIA30 family protein [Pseudohongiellaceae bacterium]|jgi:monofunctional biosynthetic peptidoglycan transglycosylase
MPLTLFDAANPQLDWYVVNDGVMGGQSDGGYSLEDDVLVFTGVTNTDGGGFSSIRTQPEALGFSDQQQIVLHARGDGRRYVCRLEDDRGTAYWADFEPPADAWGEVSIALTAFRPRFRGRWLDGPPLDPTRVTMLGLMCYDGRDGAFRLEIDRIQAV